MALRLFLDSADPQVWKDWLPRGLFHGVTTNPTLLRRAGQPCSVTSIRDLTRRAIDLGCREVHLQAWGEDSDRLKACGLELAALAPGIVVVKLPITRAGSDAGQSLIAQGLSITFTACYDVPQVLIAVALKARYIAPYLGRICALGRDGHSDLIAMQRCIDGLGADLRLLVASLRDPQDVVRLAAEGMTSFAMGPPIAEALFKSQATEAAAAQFELDARG